MADDEIGLQKTIAGIERDLAEAAKLREETNRLMATMPERYRLENLKLAAETKKLNRDPWFLIIGAIIAAVATRLPEILHAFGLPS